MNIPVRDMAVIAASNGKLPLVDLKPESVELLRKLKAISKDGVFSEKGMEVKVKIDNYLRKLNAGIVIEKRKWTSENDTLLPDTADGGVGWFYGTYRHASYVTNHEVLVLAKPDPKMRAIQGSPVLRQKAAGAISAYAGGRPSEFVILEPMCYQFDVIAKKELVWLGTPDLKIRVMLQAKYVDYLQQKFPAGTFYIKKKMAMDDIPTPAVLRVTNKGVKNNVVAIIMPCDRNGMDYPVPMRTK